MSRFTATNIESHHILVDLVSRSRVVKKIVTKHKVLIEYWS